MGARSNLFETGSIHVRENLPSAAEDERSQAAGFSLCSRILKDHGFLSTGALFDQAQILCELKAEALEEIEHNSEDVRKAIQRTGGPEA